MVNSVRILSSPDHLMACLSECSMATCPSSKSRQVEIGTTLDVHPWDMSQTMLLMSPDALHSLQPTQQIGQSMLLRPPYTTFS